MRKRGGEQITLSLDDDFADAASAELDPQRLVLKRLDHRALLKALEETPVEFREALVLRELEGLSYKEIARVIDAPIGTVMSRLARGRKAIRARLALTEARELEHEL